jgi:FkbM family methyltransferase
MLRTIAQKIRHLPGLERAEGLWSALRGPYQKLLDARGGAEVRVGGCTKVRMPAEYAGVNWEDYEPENVKVFTEWVAANPESLVLDIGSSVGIFSLLALSTSRRCRVVAFDSDPPSLAALRRLCRFVSGDRLQVVRGFVADIGRGERGRDLADAAAKTNKLLADIAPQANLESMTFTCLSHENTGDIPAYTLDELFAGDGAPAGKCLVKCDVEGAELLVLRGAERFLRGASPALLLSVHRPHMLAEYGHTQDEVKTFLQGLGYQIRVVAVDHEEHWWCEAKVPPKQS